MTRDEIFNRLAALGIARLEIPFYGGNDEGFAEDPEVYPAAGSDHAESVSPPGEAAFLAEVRDELEEPIFDKWGGFDGNVDVSGTLTWDVEARTVTLDSNWTEWSGHSSEVV